MRADNRLTNNHDMETISVFPLSTGLFPDGRLDLQIFEVR
jgi:Lon protease-like protein